jgi:hypothetical protein
MASPFGHVAGPFLPALLLVVVDWRVAVAALAVPALLAGGAGLRIDFDEAAAVAVADGGDDHATDVSSLPEFLSASRSVFTLGFMAVFALVMFNGLYYRGMLTFLPDLLSDFLEPLVGSADGALGPLSTARGTEMYLALWLRLMGAVGTPRVSIRVVR